MHLESPFPPSGTDLGALRLTVSPEANDRYWRGAGASRRPEAVDALYPPMAVNFTILLVQALVAEPVLHTWGRIETQALGSPGDVTVSGSVSDRFERRGRDYFTVTSEVRRADGARVWVAETELASSRTRPTAEAGEGSGPRRSRVEMPDAQTGLGELRRLTMTADLLRTYSRAGNFHSDDTAAQEMGLPGMVAMGMQTLGPAYALCVDAWGVDFLARGSIEARFFGLVLEDDTVEARVVRDGRSAIFALRNVTKGTTTGSGRCSLAD